jgi:hypothetical protein
MIFSGAKMIPGPAKMETSRPVITVVMRKFAGHEHRMTAERILVFRVPIKVRMRELTKKEGNVPLFSDN